MISSEEIQPKQLDKETFLARLSEADRSRFLALDNSLQEVLRQEQREGILVGVGGLLTKPLPRPDGDLLLILGPTPNDLKRKNFPNELQYALADYEIFEGIVKKAVADKEQFVIGEEIKPYPDPEYDNPNILAHDGSIKIIDPRQQGTPIEIIRIAQRGTYKEVMSGEKRPFVVL